MQKKKTSGRKWKRIHSSVPLDQLAEVKYKKREKIIKDVLFLGSCQLIDIDPTKRQARKWMNKKGIAYKNRHEARRLL